jgi:transcriptional regulator with XRE-family HTH domain
MQSGRHLLKAWRERSKQNQRTLAAALGVSDGYLSQILSGVRRPKLELLMKIEALSGVPVSSWADTRRGKSGNGRKHSANVPNVY